MHSLLITCLLLLAADPAATAPKDQGLDVEAVARRIAALDPAAQQAFLSDLETRLARANQILLPPKPAEARAAEIAAALRQPTLSWDTIRALIGETDRRERTAIIRLVRKYRVAVYEKYYGQRAEYNARLEALERVEAAWQKAASFEQQPVMIAWLHATTSGNDSVLPPDPTFTERLVLPVATTEPPAPSVDPVPATPATPASAPRKPNLPPPPLDDETPAPPTSSSPKAPGGIRLDEDRPVNKPAMPVESGPALHLDAPKIELDRAAPGGPVSSAPSSTAPLPTGAPQQPLELAPRALPGPSIEHEGSQAAAPKRRAAAIDPTELPVDLVRDEPPPVQFNFSELAALVAGNRLELRSLEAELDEERRWDPKALEDALRRLKALVAKQQGLRVFFDLMTDEQQARLGQFESPVVVGAQLARRLREAQRAVTSARYSGTPEQQQRDLARLDALVADLDQLRAGR